MRNVHFIFAIFTSNLPIILLLCILFIYDIDLLKKLILLQLTRRLPSYFRTFAELLECKSRALKMSFITPFQLSLIRTTIGSH